MSGYTAEERRIRRKVLEAERARRRAGLPPTVRAVDCLSDRPRLVLIKGGAA